MEEKLLALESLGALKGFFFRNKSNVHSNSSNKKDYNNFTQVDSFQTNAKNVTYSKSENIKSVTNQTTVKINNVERNEILLKPFREMEIETFKTDIPGPAMNIISDKNFLDDNKKTVEADKSNCKETVSVPCNDTVERDSFAGISEEIESDENDELNHESFKNKIPSTVEEWVKNHSVKERMNQKESFRDSKEEDVMVPIGDDNPLSKAQLSREVSLQSSSSLDSILDSRRPDPVEIFLNLGFGGLPGIDTENCRIPKRFLVPSKCKGGDWNEFLRRELIQAQNFECSSLGFRGLSGPSYRRPSAIVANIMEKLRERAVSQPHNRSRFSSVAKMVLSERSVLNKLTPEFQSVLSPDSRKFLQNQGKKSPEVPRRRIIFGQKSFAFANDGKFVEVDSSGVGQRGAKETTAEDCPNVLGGNDVSEDSSGFPNSEVLLKLRRSSLQKQKNVEEDTDVDDIFYVVRNEENSTESLYNSGANTTSTIGTSNDDNNNNNDCSKKTDKIPKRFLSSSNLIAFEENNDTMRLEVEKEILNLSQKIKSVSNQDLPSVLQQVKELRSKIENGNQ